MHFVFLYRRGEGAEVGGAAGFTADLSLMPSSEVPGHNSLRVQKAYR